MPKKMKSHEFLRIFKDRDEIGRKQVYSYPALYYLMNHKMIEFHKAPDINDDCYRITALGKSVLAAMLEASHN